ncbi:MAG: hypothetical protein EPO32_11770 [Anaerolineae bacterium]|nr:MAG: hypothetical protein EPO32_11770 [Anaerolineae bacterium]
MSEPARLHALQQLDLRLDAARARLAEIELALSQNAEVQAAQGAADAAKAAQHEQHTALRNAEAEVQAQQQKIANNQRTLYGGSVTNPKELEDLQNEAAALSRHLGALEERQLETMMAFEEAEASLASAQTSLEDTRARVADQNRAMTEEQKVLLTEVAELESDREDSLPEVAAEMLALYQELRGSRAGLAVVAISGNECPACGATLSAAQAQVSRSPTQIARCADCGRILVSA